MQTKYTPVEKVLQPRNCYHSNLQDSDKNHLSIMGHLKPCKESLKFFEFFSVAESYFHYQLFLEMGFP